MFGRQVGHLDADGLLAGDRRQDADLGRGERVGEVVAQRRDLADLRARRELELVARDARAGDGADQAGLDAEVLQRLGQGGATRSRAGVAGLRRARAWQHRRVGQPVVVATGAGAPRSACVAVRSSGGSSALGLGLRLRGRARPRAAGRRDGGGRARARRRAAARGPAAPARRRAPPRPRCRAAASPRGRVAAAARAARRLARLGEVAGGGQTSRTVRAARRAPGASGRRPRPRRRPWPAAARRPSARAPSSVTPASPMTPPSAPCSVPPSKPPWSRAPSPDVSSLESSSRTPIDVSATPTPIPRSRAGAVRAKSSDGDGDEHQRQRDGEGPDERRGRRPQPAAGDGAVDAEPEHEQRVDRRPADQQAEQVALLPLLPRDVGRAAPLRRGLAGRRLASSRLAGRGALRAGGARHCARFATGGGSPPYGARGRMRRIAVVLRRAAAPETAWSAWASERPGRPALRASRDGEVATIEARSERRADAAPPAPVGEPAAQRAIGGRVGDGVGMPVAQVLADGARVVAVGVPVLGLVAERLVAVRAGKARPRRGWPSGPGRRRAPGARARGCG